MNPRFEQCRKILTVTALALSASIGLLPGAARAEYENAISYGVYLPSSEGGADCLSGDLRSAWDYSRIFSCVAENSSHSYCSSIDLASGSTLSINDASDWDYSSSILRTNNSFDFWDLADEVHFPTQHDPADPFASYWNQDWPGQQGYDYVTSGGADWGDIVFVATHGETWYRGNRKDWGGIFPNNCGSYDSDRRHLSESSFTIGDRYTLPSGVTMPNGHTGDTCDVGTRAMALSGGWHSSSDDNRRANLFMTVACDSANPCIWRDGGYDNVARGNKFLMYNGFYGHHSSGGTSPSGAKDYDQRLFADYLIYSRDNYIGSNWLSNMHREKNDGTENCPVSIVFGDNDSDIDFMFDWGGGRDFKDTGDSIYSRIYYIEGCDPDGSGPYPALQGDSPQ